MTKISIKTSPSHPALPKVKMMVKRVQWKSNCQYDIEHLFDSLMEYVCMTDGTSINAFLKTQEKIAKT